MVVEYTLLLVVFVILLAGKLMADKQSDLRRWLYYYEQQKITAPYPEQIQSWQAIPPSYQNLFLPTDALPYMLFIPGSRSILRKRLEKLIVLEQDGLVLYEDGSTTKQEFPFDDILSVEHEKMLSAFWCTLVCRHKTTTIPYLSKDDTCFSAILKNLRVRSFHEAHSTSVSQDPSRSENIDDCLYKADRFGRIAKADLLPGQQIINACFQPVHQAKTNRYGGLFRKTVTYASHLAVLTDSEMIIVQESEPIRTAIYNQYAVKELFIPCRSIRQVQMEEKATTRTLILSLHGAQTVSLYVAHENEEFLAFFKDLTRAVTNHTSL